jgi:capsular exopolysaccharide synthesis family protein
LNNSQSPDQGFKQSAEGLSIDYKRIVYKSIRFWYLIVASLLLALTIAFLKNRYSQRIYPITASILVKETEELSGSELIYNNALLNFHRNYLNEPYIIKSYPLIQKVVEELNFDASFYREGNVLTTESYGDFPVKAHPVRKKSTSPMSCYFRVVNDRQFALAESEDQNPNDTLQQTFNFGDTVHYRSFTGIFVIHNNETLKNAIDQSFIFTYQPSVSLSRIYSARLAAVWAEEGAGIINLSVTGTNPAKEIDFLNGVIEGYQNDDLEKKNQTASRTVDFISNQLEAISDSLKQAERQLERFKDKNVVTDLSGEALRIYNKIEAIEGQKTELLISRNYYKYLVDYIKGDQNLDQIILPTSVGINDPILTGLVQKVTEIQLEIKMQGKRENPIVKDAIRSINSIKKDIVESIRNQESTDNIKLTYLNNQIKSAEKQLGYLPVAERNLVSIQRNYSLMENLYIFLLQKKSEAAISQASTTSDIVLVNPPTVGGPIAPKTSTNYAIAVALGLLIPLGVFALLEVVDNRVQSKEDIEKFTSIPFSGGVGHKKSDNNLAVFNQPKSLIAESFRALRSNLNYFIGQQQRAVFLITSSISGEGKTFTSINLASVFALSGKRVLIVGADMRRPKIFSDFDLHNQTGLSTYLAGLGQLTDIIQKTSFENLDLISGGPVPPNPSELLLTDKMPQFITEVKALYDFVIIDTPPLAIVTDAFVLSGYADHTLFLVRQNYTPRNLLQTIEDFYASGKLKNISIILNDIYRSGPGYGYGYGYAYGYNYGYGYGYGDKKAAGGYYTE